MGRGLALMCCFFSEKMGSFGDSGLGSPGLGALTLCECSFCSKETQEWLETDSEDSDVGEGAEGGEEDEEDSGEDSGEEEGGECIKI